MRLIDADALFVQLAEKLAHSWGREEIAYGEAMITVNNAPTIDAEPVRHGRWIPVELERSFGILKGVKCSLCGEEKVGKIGNNCPNCGAKMDTRPDHPRGCATCANDGMDMPQCRECIEHMERPWYRPKDGGAEE